WDTWNLVGNILWYQDLTTTRPVELQRVPDIRLYGLRQPVPGLSGLLYETEASATYFIRDVGSDGARVDLHPRLFYPVPVAGLFTVTPFAGGRATYYDKRVVGERVTRVGGFLVEETEDDRHVRPPPHAPHRAAGPVAGDPRPRSEGQSPVRQGHRRHRQDEPGRVRDHPAD